MVLKQQIQVFKSIQSGSLLSVLILANERSECCKWNV